MELNFKLYFKGKNKKVVSELYDIQHTLKYVGEIEDGYHEVSYTHKGEEIFGMTDFDSAVNIAFNEDIPLDQYLSDSHFSKTRRIARAQIITTMQKF